MTFPKIRLGKIFGLIFQNSPIRIKYMPQTPQIFQAGQPSTIQCTDGKWNFPAKTKIFCNQAAVAPSTPQTTSTTATTSTSTTSSTLATTSTTTKPQGSSMTDCGDARQKYLFPKEMIVECSSKKCNLSCSNGAKAIPSVLKCFAAKNKWKPRPFQKVMCVGGQG